MNDRGGVRLTYYLTRVARPGSFRPRRIPQMRPARRSHPGLRSGRLCFRAARQSAGWAGGLPFG